MAAKRSNPGPAIFAAATVIAVSGGGWFYWTGRASTPASDAAQLSPPGLPEGKLVFAGASVTEARYVVGDDIKPGQTASQVTVLIVGKTPKSVEQRYAVGVKRELVDCANRSIGQEVVGLYDQSGKLATNQVETGAAGRSVDSADHEAALACDRLQTPAWRAKTGWRAAVREFQRPPADIDAQLKAQPQDAALWAWRCRSVAQGAWRADGRQVCDKAVALAADDMSVRLDRGFLALMLRDRKAAVRDFDAIVAKHPDNAPALFGRGLVEAMNGATAASKTDRGQALKLDPKAPDWIEATYGINISSEYLKA
jgi:hypothetical protein